MIADLQRQLGVDQSFFAQFIIFLVIFTWLRLVYFKPYLKVIQAREKSSGGLAGQAAALEEDASAAEQECRNLLTADRKKAAAERDRIISEASKASSEVVGAARSQAKVLLDQARDSASRSAEAEFAALKGQVSVVSALLVEKLTKTRVGL